MVAAALPLPGAARDPGGPSIEEAAVFWLIVVGAVAVMLVAACAWDGRNRHRGAAAPDAAHKEWAIDRESKRWHCGSAQVR
jgi:hypothetical protein